MPVNLSWSRGSGDPNYGQKYVARDGTLGDFKTNNPDDFSFEGEDDFWPVSRLRQAYVDYLAAKMPEIEEQKQHRHYYNGAQYTPEQVDVLRKRRQPIVTYNRISRKIDGIVGLVERLKQEPKAYPKNPQNAGGAEIATQSIRSVLDGSNWEFLDPWCAGQACIEGIAGVELKLVQGDHQDADVAMDFIFGDDFFYDPRSAKPDFSDSRYMGIAKWLDVETAVELFPTHEDELRTLLVETGFDLTTHADREYKWIYVNEKRLRLIEHWYRNKGKWYWAFYCSNILLEQGVSPFLDERNNPMCRFVMFSACVDHDGDRYGLPRNMKGPQDELNQRRSKALHISNVSRVMVEKGSVDDVETTRREMARPDGVVEWNKGFQKPEGADQSADLQAHLALMQDARNEIDSFANIGPNVLGQSNVDEHSGVAINMLQKAGIAELGSFFRNYKKWKLDVYRAVWNILRRNWKAERFIRVSGQQNPMVPGQQQEPQFIQLNGQGTDQYGQPVVINQIGALNVEIKIDDGPDSANIMADAYDILKQDPNVPWQIKIFFMPIEDSMKKQVMQLINQPPNPMQQQGAMLDLQQKAADVEDKKAQSLERRARSVTDTMRAAHLASEAHLNQQEAVRSGLEMATGVDLPGGLPAGVPQREGAPPAPKKPAATAAPPPRVAPAPGGAPPSPPSRTAFPPPQAMAPPQRLPVHPSVVPALLARARQAPDGQHYVPDPRRPGGHMRVVPINAAAAT